MIRSVAATAFGVCAVVLVSCIGVGQAQDAKKEKYQDDKYNFSISVDSSWKSARLEEYTVPGVARAAYSKAGGASIVVFIQEPGKAFEPRFLVDESAKSMEAKLGMKTREKEVRTVAGKKAMWLIADGKGTGGAIDGKGSVETSQHWVAVPREKDIVVLLLTSPKTAFEENEKSFLTAIESLTVGGKQTSAQSESK